jgi:hypothetical protein
VSVGEGVTAVKVNDPVSYQRKTVDIHVTSSK